MAIESMPTLPTEDLPASEVTLSPEQKRLSTEEQEILDSPTRGGGFLTLDIRIQEAPPEMNLKSDKDFLLQAAEKNPGAVLRVASPELLRDKNFVREILSKDGSEPGAEGVFQLGSPEMNTLPAELWDDEEIAAELLLRGGGDIFLVGYLSPRLKQDKEFVQKNVLPVVEGTRIIAIDETVKGAETDWEKSRFTQAWAEKRKAEELKEMDRELKVLLDPRFKDYFFSMLQNAHGRMLKERNIRDPQSYGIADDAYLREFLWKDMRTIDQGGVMTRDALLRDFSNRVDNGLPLESLYR